MGTAPPTELRTELAQGSIVLAAHETALAVPSRPAVDIDGVSLTHGELDQRAARTAGWLRRRGLEPGDVILISSPSSLALVVAYLGSLRAEGTVVLANPAYTEAELEYLVEDSGARVALGAGPGLERMESIAARRQRALDVVALDRLCSEQSAVDGELALAPVLEPPLPDPERPALLAYTSGTTGRPKTVPLLDANVLSSIRAVMLAWRWSREDVLVHALPLFHQHGLGGLHTALLSGSCAVIQSRFDPEQLCRGIDAARASVLFAVPSMYGRLAEWQGNQAVALRALRLLVSGSAPLSPVLAERIAQLAGQPPLDRFGTTESGLDASNPYADARVLASVGLPLPGVELAIADEHGHTLDPGHEGEIVVRGPQVFRGYRGAPEANLEAFYPGKWFRTGDVGRIEPSNGYLHITGRSRELIISGGMNVYPREVEFALEAHPAVARAAVVGVPSERWGEAVVAAVVPAAGVSRPLDQELLDFTRSRLAPYKCPKRVLFVSELPVNAMGKTVAAEVRGLF